MLRKTVRCYISVPRTGYWNPTDRQRRSLGERGTHMRAVSQERFASRQAKFRVQQEANLDLMQRDHGLRHVQRQLMQNAVYAAHRHRGPAAEGQDTAPSTGPSARGTNMAAARELLQLGEHARRELKRNRGFAQRELQSRRSEYVRKR